MSGFAQLFGATRAALAAEGVRPGFRSITGKVRFDSAAPEADLERLKRVVDAHCPVLDLFNNATPVKIVIAEQVAA